MPDDGYLLDTPTTRRVDRVLRRAQNAGNRTADLRDGVPAEQETCWGKLTSRVTPGSPGDPAKFEWTEVRRKSDDTWQTATNGRDGDFSRDDPYKTLAYELLPGRATINQIVLLRRTPIRQDDGSYQMAWTIIAPIRAFFPVRVTIDSDPGAEGNSTTTCTLTYTVKDLAGEFLATLQTPERTRYDNCEYDQVTANSPASAYYDESGAFHLYDVAGEKPKGDVVTVQTDYQIDTGSLKFQKKTRSVLVLEAGDESDWTDVHTGESCPT